MNNQNSDISKKPEVFKYKGQVYFFIGWVVWIGAFFSLVYIAEERRLLHHLPISSGNVIFWCLFLFSSLSGFFQVRGQSDIVIDDMCISRSFMGWTWQTIRWDNIEQIIFNPYFNNRSQKTVRLMSIYPLVRPQFRLTLFGGMAFSDDVVNTNELIEVMNRYITQYEIKMLTLENGKKTSVSHL